jgi:hypothetical protein
MDLGRIPACSTVVKGLPHPKSSGLFGAFEELRFGRKVPNLAVAVAVC